MKKTIVFCFALAIFSCLRAQTTPASNPSSDKVYTVVQQKPVFPGDINKWLGDNLVYPQDARKNNIQGTVYVSFIIETGGSVSSVKVLRGVQGGRLLENEAVRVVSGMPKWNPGMQGGVPVRVAYMVPIHFVLNDTPSPTRQ